MDDKKDLNDNFPSYIIFIYCIDHLFFIVFVSIKEMTLILTERDDKFIKKVDKFTVSNLVQYYCRSLARWPKNHLQQLFLMKKRYENSKKMISTSKQYVKHPLAVQNMKH